MRGSGFAGAQVGGGDHALGDALDQHVMEGAFVGAGKDLLIGTGVANILDGGADDDAVRGGTGADLLTGGGGADLFLFVYVDAQKLYDSGTKLADRDVITDFTPGVDDLRILNNVVGGVPLLIMGTGAFTAANQIRWISGGGNTTVFVNTDADLNAEMAITLTGVTGLQSTDFL